LPPIRFDRGRAYPYIHIPPEGETETEYL
jgi:hypothetical protein